MVRAWSWFHKHQKSAVLAIALALAVFGPAQADAQDPPPQPCDKEVSDEVPAVQCPPGIPLDPNGPEISQAVPLMDGSTQRLWPPMSVTGHQEVVTLYGTYGNDERIPPSGPQYDHYQRGITEGNNIHPLCLDGTTNCPTSSRAIVFLFIGFSNCDIEVCGGNKDIWQQQIGGDPNPLPGQPCSTPCNNPRMFPQPGYHPWNDAGDGGTQQSFLYRVYSPQTPLVGAHVYVFDGALGHQTLERWDPNGYYANNNCDLLHEQFHDGECNYKRIANDLTNSITGFSEAQVQAIFIKASTAGPQCDLSGLHCVSGVTLPDAYKSEQYLGNIVRYLKCCKANGQPRYRNLHQVFITSRTYGGYAQDPNHNACKLNPEPFAYQTVTSLPLECNV